MEDASIHARKNNIINGVLFFSTILVFILIVVFSVLTPITADDYAHFVEVRDSSLFKWISFVYNNYTGKSVSVILQPLLFSTKFGLILTKALSACFLFFIPLLVYRISNLRLNKRVYGFVSLIFILSHQEFLAEDVFWATGGVAYTWPLFLSLLWILILKEKQFHNNFKFVLSIFLGLFVGMASEQTAPITILSTISIVSVYIINEKKESYDIKVNRILFLLFLIIIGFLLFLIAPGNYARASSSGDYSFSINGFIKNVIQVLVASLINGRFSLIGGTITGFFISSLSYYGLLDIMEKSRRDNRILLALCGFFGVAAFASLGPFYFLPMFLTHRVFFFSAIFYFITSSIISFIINEWVRKKLTGNGVVLYNYFFITGLVFSFNFFVFPQYVDGVLSIRRSVMVSLVVSIVFTLLSYLIHSLFRVKAGNYLSPNGKRGNVVEIIIFIFVLACVQVVIVPQTKKLLPLTREITQRERYLRSVVDGNNDVIVVKKIASPIPTWVHYRDIIYGANDWVNRLYARYLEIPSVETQD